MATTKYYTYRLYIFRKLFNTASFESSLPASDFIRDCIIFRHARVMRLIFLPTWRPTVAFTTKHLGPKNVSNIFLVYWIKPFMGWTVFLVEVLTINYWTLLWLNTSLFINDRHSVLELTIVCKNLTQSWFSFSTGYLNLTSLENQLTHLAVTALHSYRETKRSTKNEVETK